MCGYSLITHIPTTHVQYLKSMKQTTTYIFLLLLLIVLVSGAVVWSFLSLGQLVISVALLLFDLGLVVLVVDMNKKVQRKVAYFFDAVENNDSTIFFSDKVNSRTEKDLNVSLNRVNDLIKQVKLRLVEQEKYYQVLLEHSSSGIICFDASGRVMLANHAATQLLGLHVLTHLKQLIRVDEHLYERISKISGKDSFSISIMTDRGRVQLSISTSIFKMDDKEMRLLSLQDISTPLSDKEMASWTKLTQVLTHEIMNNLAPVISLSQDIQKRIETSNLDPIKAQKAFEIIQSQSESLLHFVETYRQFTKIPLPVKQDILVADLFDRIRILYGALGQSERVQLEVTNPDEELRLFVDEGQMVQVLINLVKNAVEAFDDADHGIVKVWAEGGIDSDRVCVFVSDNGSGVPEELKEDIFVPFFTTKEKGSGIGLSLVSQMLRLHNGSIELMDGADETVFRICI